MTKAIITVVGKDAPGIIASVCVYLANNDVNILDITQTIVEGYFNMMMIVDVTKCNKNFDDLSDGLTQLGQKIGVQTKIQLAEIFNQMHRL